MKWRVIQHNSTAAQHGQLSGMFCCQGGNPRIVIDYILRDIPSNSATPMSVITNPFCASGMHFPNGSWATFGGHGAVGPGGNISDVTGPTGTGPCTLRLAQPLNFLISL